MFLVQKDFGKFFFSHSTFIKLFHCAITVLWNTMLSVYRQLHSTPTGRFLYFVYIVAFLFCIVLFVVFLKFLCQYVSLFLKLFLLTLNGLHTTQQNDKDFFWSQSEPTPICQFSQKLGDSNINPQSISQGSTGSTGNIRMMSDSNASEQHTFKGAQEVCSADN